MNKKNKKNEEKKANTGKSKPMKVFNKQKKETK